MQAIRAGVVYTASISPSYLVFGAVCGVASKQAGLSLIQAILLPALVFGGSSQVVLTSMLIAAAPIWVVIVSAMIVNSRMAVYSAIFSGWLRSAPQRVRYAVAPLLVDQTFVGVKGFSKDPQAQPEWLPFYFGSGLTLWMFWVFCNVIGYVAGTIVPAQWELDFVVPLSFVAVLAPIIKRLPMAIAAALGSILGTLFFALPLKLGLIAACFLGVAIAMIFDTVFQWTTQRSGSQ